MARSDCFIDDTIQVFLDTEENRKKQPHVVPLAVHVSCRPNAGDDVTGLLWLDTFKSLLLQPTSRHPESLYDRILLNLVHPGFRSGISRHGAQPLPPLEASARKTGKIGRSVCTRHIVFHLPENARISKSSILNANRTYLIIFVSIRSRKSRCSSFEFV